jgi:hypothetical protein
MLLTGEQLMPGGGQGWVVHPHCCVWYLLLLFELFYELGVFKLT